MKLLILLALFAAIVYALPVEEVSQDQAEAEPLLTVVDLDAAVVDSQDSDAIREKRQFGGYGHGGYGGYGGGHRGGYGGYGGGYGGFGGGYGGHGGHHRGGHHGK